MAGNVISGVRHDAEHRGIPAHRQAHCTRCPPPSFPGHDDGGRRKVEDRHGVSSLAEEASSPYGAINRGVVLPEPGVSWSSLQNMRYQGPEQRSRNLPNSLSRIQHDYGDPAVPIAP